ncbi:MAG TPA: hypothetical protein VM070_00280, partial [Candidatus Saccharimonadales bacterium]|nr:hypothetical protein [Candidatus Saccharimonadales bacterium]
MLIALGALALGVAIAALVLSLQRRSPVELRLARIAPPGARAVRWRPAGDRDLAQSDTGLDQQGLVHAKVLAAVAGLGIGLAVTASLSLSVLFAALPAYAAAVAPSVIVERRAAARRREAEQATGAVVERIEALVAAGRPAESALASVARRTTGSPLLDRVLGQV